MVVRIDNSTGALRLSRPCSMCIHMMKFYHIRRVYYSTNEETIVSERVANMDEETAANSRGLIDAITHLRFASRIPVSKKTKARLLKERGINESE